MRLSEPLMLELIQLSGLKMISSEDGFSGLDIVLISALVIVIAVAGYFAYTNVTKAKPVATSSTVAKHSPTPGPSKSPDPFAGWKTGKLGTENVTFMYPPNWSLSDANSGTSYTGFLALKDSTGFTIDIDAFKSDSQNASLGGSLGATTFNATVATLSLGGKSAYLIDAASQHLYSGTVLSACTGAKKCLFKSPITGDDIEVTIVYNKPGKTNSTGGPDNFDPAMPGYQEALKIANTLSL
jgi:hypothetical protein